MTFCVPLFILSVASYLSVFILSVTSCVLIFFLSKTVCLSVSTDLMSAIFILSVTA